MRDASSWLSGIRSFSGVGALSNGEMESLAISLRIGFEDEMHRIFISASTSDHETLLSLVELVLESVRMALVRRTGVQLPSEMPGGFGGASVLMDGILSYRSFGKSSFLPSPYHERVNVLPSPFYGAFQRGYLVLTPSYLVSFEKPVALEKVLEEWKKIPDAAVSVIGVNIGISGFALRGKKALSSISDRGLVRRNNEDSCLSSTVEISRSGDRTRYNILCVADGVGGAGYGEIASREAVLEAYNSLIIGILSSSDEREIVRASISSANRRVLEEKKRRGEMGTTMTLALIRDNYVTIGHAGDSRAYLIDEGIKQITRDHKYVEDLVERGLITREQAKYHPQRNIITSALGMENPRIDLNEQRISDRTSLLLTTDGLPDLVDDSEILACFINYPPHPDLIGGLLVRMANARGGHDNTSVSIMTHLI